MWREWHNAYQKKHGDSNHCLFCCAIRQGDDLFKATGCISDRGSLYTVSIDIEAGKRWFLRGNERTFDLFADTRLPSSVACSPGFTRAAIRAFLKELACRYPRHRIECEPTDKRRARVYSLYLHRCGYKVTINHIGDDIYLRAEKEVLL